MASGKTGEKHMKEKSIRKKWVISNKETQDWYDKFSTKTSKLGAYFTF